MPTDKHEDKKLTPQEWRDKDLGDTVERMRAANAKEVDPLHQDCPPPVVDEHLARLFYILRLKSQFLMGFGSALGENGKPLRREAGDIVTLIGRYERGKALSGPGTAGVTMTEE